MAKEEKEKKGGEGEKSKRKHLHRVVTEAAHDGTYVHHHTYKENAMDHHTEPERQNVATSSSPDEAGQHVAEQMAMNEQQGGDPGEMEQPQPDAAGGGAPMPGQ